MPATDPVSVVSSKTPAASSTASGGELATSLSVIVA
ncbi:hypothetical protein R2601_04598 [Salipiger bermudensis HTCC2601]|uniref:Uncharacterized protein n=1 Tax=Salipiger bermudensis (strain DSM 26914 / JCM 13377 / KCTC 12554 / HTCC2601) TaxID=314265 RepID=Q0FVS6_SALBH|nr:hypothetical protein R2601_04598 [Salipiger bermudensis HTCC2601]